MKRGGSNGKRDREENSEKQAGTPHGILLLDQTPSYALGEREATTLNV
jgi:hypothetical protein